ncbi:unnamed protein product, partial [Scytosiphon promiscuus]
DPKACPATIRNATSTVQMIGVYVSAGWCPPCRSFSPVLSK